MGLEGKLTDMPMLDLLRVFQRSARTGKLVIWCETEWALLCIKHGEVVTAVVLQRPSRRQLHSGEQAIFQLFTWPEGSFRYTPDDANSCYPITIQRPTGELIVEALQRRRSAAAPAVTAELTLQTRLSVLPQMAGTNEYLRLSVDEWTVLVRIEQHLNAEAITAETGLPPGRVLAIVSHLIDLGLVMPVPLAELPRRRLTVELSGNSEGHPLGQGPITNLTRAIKRRLQQIATEARLSHA